MKYRMLMVDMRGMRHMSNLNKENVGRAIYEVRMRKNLLLRQIAVDAGITVSALSMIERGLRRPMDRTFYRLVLTLKKLAA